jgi:YidC/Oxa1 family membrane protein insertase
MFTTLIVQPIFNLLVLIYGLLPGHNFGLALIIFTVIIRLLMWPLLRKQLHQTKVMRKLQPEVKRIKKETKGNRQKEMQMTMELYKERGFNPYASFPTLIVQFIVLIGLYSGLQKVIHDPHNLVTFAYPALQHLPFMEELAHNIHMFDNTLFGIVDLSKAALGSYGIYWPAMIIVVASAVTQYFQSKQLLPQDKEARGLRQILKESGNGPQPDQSEVNAAVTRSTIFLLPIMIFVITVRFASALSLYWFVGGLVAYIQQSIVLREDEEELEAMADQPTKKDVAGIPEAEVVEAKPAKPKTKPKKSSNAKSRKRKKR